MTSEQIEVIAKAVAEQQISANWLYYVMLALITVVMSAAGAYFGSYWKKRGEHLATKQDFADLLNRVERTTEVTTAIKTQIEHADWTRKEYITLKRQKAESLLDSIQD